MNRGGFVLSLLMGASTEGRTIFSNAPNTKSLVKKGVQLFHPSLHFSVKLTYSVEDGVLMYWVEKELIDFC